ncbi:lysis system i-spanin subunit Rz [Pseudomonas sp. TMW 2.1634]|uniref:lysis system i-spanin subunit Rz n=1 Tax=Pseudomonas sp. TMW 2.1634 TaxID=1886807 RepID=UPI000E76DC03|nr:lysis system i-spanin subunit Rz [Pseudomonas sp. TMW 2.1634]AOA08379.1 lysis protein [Pseudomonas sp. TMW 2.1634]
MTISLPRLALFLLLISLMAYVLFDDVADQRDNALGKRDAAVRELGSVTTERDGLLEAARISREMLAAREANDLKNTLELNDALDHNKSLQRAVDDGRQRLLVKARCSTATAVPGATSTGSMADAGPAELAADARSDYFTLRNQLALTRQMVLGLQDYIRTVVQRPPAKP